MLARIIVMFVLLFIVLNISNYSPATLVIASTSNTEYLGKSTR